MMLEVVVRQSQVHQIFLYLDSLSFSIDHTDHCSPVWHLAANIRGKSEVTDNCFVFIGDPVTSFFFFLWDIVCCHQLLSFAARWCLNSKYLLRPEVFKTIAFTCLYALALVAIAVPECFATAMVSVRESWTSSARPSFLFAAGESSLCASPRCFTGGWAVN